MRAWSFFRRGAGAGLIAIALPAVVAGQAVPVPAAQTPAASARIAMTDAVRLALERNHQLRAQRLNVDPSKADEVTAALKPNPVLTSTNENFPIFSPSDLFSRDNFANNLNFVESVSYLFERGGKRDKRTQVARDTTNVASKSAADAERQLAFQTERAFINVLLANSTLDLARENLKNFENVVDVNRERMRAGDLAESEFYKISLQKLQFEQKSLEDIGHIVIAAHAGIPVTVNDVGTVAIGSAPRLGQFGFMKQNGAVEGVILMRVGEQAQVILKKVQELTATLNRGVLPPDVKIIPYYDWTDLIEETTKTVERNLLRGMILVLVVLGIFLFSVRTALIVAATIPFALLFSFICLDWRHIPANLLSIGAIDFGIIVDGAVVMVENIFRELAERHGQKYDLMAVIRSAAKDVERPIFYAIAVIVAGYLPIYVLTGPSGRLFRPMADTMGFALLGSLICTLTLLPVLCSYVLRKQVKEPTVQVYERLRRSYGRLLERCLRRRGVTLAFRLSVFGASLLLVPYIGAEFMPHLDEGALWVRATMPYTISFDEASKLGPQVRDLLLGFPQVTTVANELGRPDDGTDPIGFVNDEYFVGLKPYSDAAWAGSIKTKPQLIAAVQDKLKAFPGIIFNYTQPAEDAVDEAETGLKSSLAVKIFGADLSTLEAKAEAVQKAISTVPGIANITLVRELGQPSLTIEPDRAKIARYGLNVADINALIETAVGGAPATQVIQGERSFDLVVRLQEPYRQNMEAIKNILVATPDNQHLPLSQFADIKVSKGASFVYRESNSRVIGIQFSVEGRDLASAVADARKKVDTTVPLPTGYTYDWGGEYKEYLSARSQMALILPMTIVQILLILFGLCGNLKFPLIIVFSVLVTEPVGGLLALKLTGTHFSVSSGLGFVALMGVAVQTSVILYSFINKLRLEGKDIKTATHQASLLRLRPIMMTALVACIGLLPAAMSTGIGSDSQKPFAIVIVGDLVSRLALSIFLAPVPYALVAKDDDVLKV